MYTLNVLGSIECFNKINIYQNKIYRDILNGKSNKNRDNIYVKIRISKIAVNVLINLILTKMKSK